MRQFSTKYIIGNWKMYGTLQESTVRVRSLVKKFGTNRTYPFTMIVCPPAVFLERMAQEIQGSVIQLGAQNCHWQTQGAFTGEVSPSMLVDIGCTYVILGHSERRQNLHETNTQIVKKVQCALDVGLVPIVCIGENREQRQQNQTQEVIEQQILESLPSLSPEQEVLLSYEPLWAIGTKTAADPQLVHTTLHSILTLLQSRYKRRIPLLYGGSITPQNAHSIVSLDVVDGLLIGSASLDAQAFWAIAQTVM